MSPLRVFHLVLSTKTTTTATMTTATMTTTTTMTAAMLSSVTQKFQNGKRSEKGCYSK